MLNNTIKLILLILFFIFLESLIPVYSQQSCTGTQYTGSCPVYRCQKLTTKYYVDDLGVKHWWYRCSSTDEGELLNCTSKMYGGTVSCGIEYDNNNWCTPGYDSCTYNSCNTSTGGGWLPCAQPTPTPRPPTPTPTPVTVCKPLGD